MKLVFLLALSAYAVRSDQYHPDSSEGVYTAAVPDPAELTAQFWVSEAQAAIKARAKHSAGGGKARNVVLFMGDGMSVPTLAAARILLGQRKGKTGEESKLSFETFPAVGLTKTYCVDNQIPDSACTATAFLSGVKNNVGVLGLTAAVQRRDCQASLDPNTHAESIAAWALADGRDVGIVTNTRVTDASPGAVYAQTADRSWESDAAVRAAGQDPAQCPDIAHQLVHMNPGKNFKVILGGGRREFLSNNTNDEEGTQGRRTDDRDLIEEWKNDKQNRSANFAYVWNREQLMQASEELPEYLLGLFAGSDMPYHLESNKATQPTLTEMTEVAIKSLKRNEKGFFLFVESGLIDHGHHDNLAQLALDETIRMSEAVAKAAELLSEEDSLIVVTADHAHVMSFNGYRRRGGDILGTTDLRDLNGVPSMTLSYTNGPGARPQVDGLRVDVTKEPNHGQLRWRSHAELPLRAETHGGDDVAVFARGPHSHMFTGLYEQSQLPHLMAYAGCFGPGETAAGCFGSGETACNAATATTIGNTLMFTLIALVLARIFEN